MVTESIIGTLAHGGNPFAGWFKPNERPTPNAPKAMFTSACCGAVIWKTWQIRPKRDRKYIFILGSALIAANFYREVEPFLED